MTDQLPEAAWLYEYSDGEREWWRVPDAFEGKHLTKFLRADTAVTKDEAAASAAFEQAVREAEQRGWARGMEAKVHNAAEAAVREAVEAERERCARIAAAFTPDDEWDRGGLIAAAIRASQETRE